MLKFKHEDNKTGKYVRFLMCALCLTVLSPFAIADEERGLDLPDFSRTYGYDSRPDVRLHRNSGSKSKSGAAPAKKKTNSFKNKIKRKFTKTGKTGTKYGVQRYTKHTGSKRYGVGLKKKLGKDAKHGVIVHQGGANYEIEKKNRKYYLGVDQRRPEQTFNQDKSTYLFFGIKLRW